MKLQIASGLHHGLSQDQPELAGPLHPVPEADVLILVGDIHEGTKTIAIYADHPCPVVHVHGSIHQSSDYRIGDYRVVCNPRGKPGKNRHSTDVRYEKLNINPSLVIEV